MSRGAPLPGARAVEGSQASEGGKDAGAGAHPPGRSCGPGAQRGNGARPGPLVDGGIPWPRQSDHKGGCGRGARGSRRGADGSGDSAARGGPGRGRPGRAVAALRLLKSKQLSVLRAVSGRPAPLPVSPLTFGRLQFRERHVFKFWWVRNLPELQSATKGRRSRRLAAGAEPGRLPRGARAPSPPRAHRLVLSLSRLVLEAMEEAEADCAVAFAEAQRWVEVSAFPPLLSARVCGRRGAKATPATLRFSLLRARRGRVAAGRFACAVSGRTFQVLLSFNVQLSLALPSLRRSRRLPQSSSAPAESSAGPPRVGDRASL